MIWTDAILFERTERNELGVTISKQVTLRISFQDPHFSSKATEKGLFLINLEAAAEETCFKARVWFISGIQYYVNIRYINHQTAYITGTSGDNWGAWQFPWKWKSDQTWVHRLAGQVKIKNVTSWYFKNHIFLTNGQNNAVLGLRPRQWLTLTED